MKPQLGILKDYKGDLLLGKLDTKDLLLLNVIYQRPLKENEYHDYCYVVLKNVRTGEKKLVTLEDPDMLIYVVKPEYRDYTHYPMYKALNMCDTYRVKYKSIEKFIGKVGGENTQAYLDNCIRNNYAAAKNLHKWPYVLGSDYQYENYFRVEWALHYHNQDIEIKPTKMYLDIEVDTRSIIGFPRPGECPINAVSLIDEHTSTVFVYLLDDPNNPQITDFINDMDGFIQRCHEAFDEFYGVLDYQIQFFEDEMDLIKSVWGKINELKRDFLEVWNLSFDIPYFIARIEALGEDPKSIMCHPDFKTPILSYRPDTSTYEWKKKNDVFIISSYTVFLDQMSDYIKIRKGKSELKNVKLNAVAWKELRDEKLDYSDEADIKTLCEKNFALFTMYNIKDTLLQMGIERKTNDINTVYFTALDNATAFQSVFSQTIVLKNYAYLSYYEQGYIIGNNKNVNYGEPRNYDRKKKKPDFEGALVADPMLNSHIGMTLFGKPSMFVFLLVVDFDFSSMYPSITIAHNINPETMIGKVCLDGFGHFNPNPTDELYDQGKMFIEDLLSKDYGHIGKRYFNLPDTEELLKELESI